MKPRTWVLLAAVAAGLAAGPKVATAQEANLSSLDDTEANRVYVRTGAEYGFVAALGYARTVHPFGHGALVNAEVTTPWASPDAADYRVRIGAVVPLVAFGRWKLAGTLAPVLRSTNNDLGRMTNVGFDGAGVAGYYAARWFAAGELGFDYALTTHIDHSDQYRRRVYAEARDGWYVNPGGTFRAGAQAGASFGRIEVAVRAGILRDMDGAPPLLPFYGTLALTTRW